MKITPILMIMIGGALGALCRYGVSGLAGRVFEVQSHFPAGTLAVNLLGCLLIGILWGVPGMERVPIEWRNLIFVGFLGAFTTFSTYALDVDGLWKSGALTQAVLYILVSNIGGILLVFGGMFLAKNLGGQGIS